MAQSGNLIYIIGILYSLIIIGIAMYIISKTTEEASRCDFFRKIETNTSSGLPSNIPPDISTDMSFSVFDGKLHFGDKLVTKYQFKAGETVPSWDYNQGDANKQFDVLYNTKDDIEMTMRLECNTGSYEFGGVTQPTSNDIVAPVSAVTAGVGQQDNALFVQGARFDEVPSSKTDGILLIAPAVASGGARRLCLINPYISENYEVASGEHFPGLSQEMRKNYDKYNTHCLLNYHLKTAYNCCAINSTKNSFVNTCALKYCMDNGAKCLDFEIYSVGGEAVVGVNSETDNINMKESYNKISLIDVLDTINTRMDVAHPTILYLRVKSDRIELLESIQNCLMNSQLSKRLVCKNPKYGNFWSYEHYEKTAISEETPVRNILKEKLTDLKGDQNIIIVLDLSETTKWGKIVENKNFCATLSDAGLNNLGKIVNLMAPSEQVKNYSINKITAMTPGEKGVLREDAQKKIIFVQPDPAMPYKDDFIEMGVDIGCQLVAAPLQYTKKANVIAYETKFKKSQYIYKDSQSL